MAEMRIRRVVAIALAIATCTAFVVACGGGPRLRYRHEFTLAPGQQHHAGLAKALLLPLDFAHPEPIKGLNVSNEKIASLIVAHLESKGMTVERVDAKRFRAAADSAFRAVQAERKSGASGVVSAKVGLGDVVPRIVEELKLKPDLVVAGNVVMRTGQWNGGSTLVWDGVRRRDRTAGAGATTGTTPAASLEVALHGPDGARVFWGYGGLDLVFRFNLQQKVMEIRPDLLQNDENLAEGVCVAFYPYFGMEEYCDR